MPPGEQSHGLGKQITMLQNREWDYADDFGLRNPVIQKKRSKKCASPIAARVH